MDTIVLRTVSFFSQTISARRGKAAFSRSHRHPSAVFTTPVIAGSRRDPLSGRAGARGTAMASCSVIDNLPLFVWHDAPMTPEDAGTARSQRGFLPHLKWEQIALLLGSVGSECRRV